MPLALFYFLSATHAKENSAFSNASSDKKILRLVLLSVTVRLKGSTTLLNHKNRMGLILQ